MKVVIFFNGVTWRFFYHITHFLMEVPFKYFQFLYGRHTFFPRQSLEPIPNIKKGLEHILDGTGVYKMKMT